MDPVGGVIQGVSSLGNLALKGLAARRARQAAQQRARELNQLSYNLYSNFNAPNPQISDSYTAGSQADPRALEAQDTVLQELLRRGFQEGLTPQEEANMARIGYQQRSNQNAHEQAAIARLSEMGLSASPGQLLAASQAGGQAAANQAYQGGLDTAAMAQDRAMGSLESAKGLSTTARGQSFEESFNRNNAQDILNRFNASLTQNAFNQELQKRNQQSALQSAAVGANYDAGMVPAQTLSAFGDTVGSIGNNIGAMYMNQKTPKPDKNDPDYYGNYTPNRNRGMIGGFGG